MENVTTFLLAFAALSLSACGGGGGSSADIPSSVASIVIPDGVTSIGGYAFSGCSFLTSIFCEAPSKPQGRNSDWNYGCDAEVIWGYKG